MPFDNGNGAAENVSESFHFLCKQKNYFSSSIMEHLLYEGNFDNSGDTCFNFRKRRCFRFQNMYNESLSQEEF